MAPWSLFLLLLLRLLRLLLLLRLLRLLLLLLLAARGGATRTRETRIVRTCSSAGRPGTAPPLSTRSSRPRRGSPISVALSALCARVAMWSRDVMGRITRVRCGRTNGRRASTGRSAPSLASGRSGSQAAACTSKRRPPTWSGHRTWQRGSACMRTCHLRKSASSCSRARPVHRPAASSTIQPAGGPRTTTSCVPPSQTSEHMREWSGTSRHGST